MSTIQHISVDQKAIKRLLKKGMKPWAVSRRLGIPPSVCYDIAKGKDRHYYINRGALENKKGIKLCERCKRREIYPGFEKLCLICWKIG